MTGRAALATVLFGAVFLSAGATGHASPVALYDAGEAEGDVALGGGEALIGLSGPTGELRVDAVPVAGGAPRGLLAVPLPKRGWDGLVRLAASAQRVAALVSFDDEEDAPVEGRVYSGRPGEPIELLTSARRDQGEGWLPGDLDLDADLLLISEFRFDPFGVRASVFPPAGAPEPVALPPAALPEALAGDFVAYLGSTRQDPDGRINRVFVADRRTGAVRATIALRRASDDVEYRDLDLSAGGRVVVSVDGRLLTAAPGIPQRRVRGSASRTLYAPRLAGNRIVALASTRLGAQRVVVLDPSSGRLRRVGPPSTALDAVVSDGSTIVWLANGCVIAAGLDAGPFSAPPPGACPRAEVFLDEHDQVLRGRRLGIVVSCVAAPSPGCRGVVELRGGTFGRGNVVARGRFRVRAARRQLIDVTFTKTGLRGARQAVRREGAAALGLSAKVRDGRVSDSAGTSGAAIDRIADRRRR